MVGPTVGASVAIRPISGETTLRREGGKMVKAAAKTDGIIPPPRKPCSPRHRIISVMDPEVAHMKLAAVNPAAARVNSRRVDIIRARKPDSGIITTSAIR